MSQHLLFVVLGIAAAGVLGCRADCHACASGSNVACISETQFQFCANNQTVGPTGSCPTGSYCTSQLSICQRNVALKACGSCGECNSDATFACLDSRTFALCQGGSRPTNITGSCSEGDVCNRDLPQICGNASVTSPSCPESTTPENTTPESTTIAPDDFCRTAFKGIPIHAIPNDTECTSYIYCRFYIDSWVGRIIDCPDSKPYFNGWTLCCGTTKATRPGCLLA